MFLRASMLLESQRWADSFADLEAVAALDGADTANYHNRGLCCFFLGRIDEAVELVNQGMALSEEMPNFGESLVLRAYCWSSLGEADLAIEDLDRAIPLFKEGDKGLVEAYHQRGVLYARKQDWEPALADFAVAISLDPQPAKLHLKRGIVYMNSERPLKAIAEFGKAISLDPLEGEAHANRAQIYKARGRLDEAIEDCTQAIGLIPDWTFARAIAYLTRPNATSFRENTVGLWKISIC